MILFRGQLGDDDPMPFGKWKGERLGDIPNSYFRWLREQDWLNQHHALAKYVNERDWDDDDIAEDESPYWDREHD